MIDLVASLAGEFRRNATHVAQVLELLAEDNTIPFIARYRKERTGDMDEVVLRDLRDRARQLTELEERRATILASVQAQEKLTPELKRRIEEAASRQALEDLYLPYRPKRRTRASVARELGLEPLAFAVFLQPMADAAAHAAVRDFIADHEEGISAEEAWSGCRDIIAERVAEDADTRAWIRDITVRKGRIAASVTKQYAGRRTKYSDYYEFEEPLARIPAHRYLAVRRGETEKVLQLRIDAPEADIAAYLARTWNKGAEGHLRDQWRLVLDDAYRRLIAASLESELRGRKKEEADAASTVIFSENLRNLLLQPPGGQRVVMGLDPGLRSGCKWAVVDGTGKLLDHGTIYPLPPQNQAGQSARTLEAAIRHHGVEVLAIGNGTGGRELFAFVRHAVKAASLAAQAVLVSEAGASVYSASDIARSEFPDLDLTLRGAISIARRWQDPLAELVKIDPKSIGVGQYQHDVDQKRLRQALDETVEFCVNRVGVVLNTASWALLRYVSGLGPALAKELVVYRDARGAFASRTALLQVPRLGQKAFQQCAGFLRIPGAANPLDATGVHPEHYSVVERMAADGGVAVSELARDEALVGRIDPEGYVGDGVGLPTLRDILDELSRPGRDPRITAESVRFNESVTEMGHLQAGMQLNGVVTNVTHFGAFVDIGVHQDGLVHVSQMADRYVTSPAEIVRVGQAVWVTVLNVDEERKRIGLSLKHAIGGAKPDPATGQTSQRGARAGARSDRSR